MCKEKATQTRHPGSLEIEKIQADSIIDAPIQSTTTEAQRAKIYQLLQHRPYSTLELRALGICSPAPRIKELRDSGHTIVTHRRQETDSAGVKHRIGVYALLSEHAELQP